MTAAHVEQRAHDDARTAADHADNARLRAQVAQLIDRLVVAQWVATRLRQQLDQAVAARGEEPTTAWGDPRPSVAGGERW